MRALHRPLLLAAPTAHRAAPSLETMQGPTGFPGLQAFRNSGTCSEERGRQGDGKEGAAFPRLLLRWQSRVFWTEMEAEKHGGALQGGPKGTSPVDSRSR